MKDEIKKQTCENCRYFLWHFIKRDSRYHSVHCGHCKNPENKKSRRQPHDACGHWEDMVIAKEERKRAIEDTLEGMRERLDEIASILKDDWN